MEISANYQFRIRLHPLAGYVLRRLAVGAALVAVLSTLVFAATHSLGDPAGAILGPHAPPALKQQVRKELGLDRPLLTQYRDWLTSFARGDFGRSLASGRAVSEYLGSPVKNTLELALATLAVVVPLSLLLGVWTGIRPNSLLDQVVSGLTLGAIALPEFVIGALLALCFAVVLGLFPPVSLIPPGSNPLAHPDLLALPVATLTLTSLACLVRMVRAGVIEVMGSEYVQMARLNGLSERRVIWRHGLPNALATAVQSLALTIQWLVGGVAIVETVFAYPGFGQAMVGAVHQRDITVLQAGILLVAVFLITINVVADVLVIFLVPKLRTTR